MNVASNLSGADILAIAQPEPLFGSPDKISGIYKELARIWHPDMPTGDNEVFQHIAVLHDQAKHLVSTNTWQIPGELSFDSNGKSYALRYFKSFDFELGKVYLSETRVTYVIRNEFADLVENARKVIDGLRFPDKATQEVMFRYLPVIKGIYETVDNIVVMISKPADLIRMRDLLDHLGGAIDAKHVAWMVSRMLNHTSYLEWARLSHNDFSLDTLFVCPEQHTVCVLGGWWYSVPVGERLKALPQRTINNTPDEVIRSKKASLLTDAGLIRLTSRELLGNANGIHLTKTNIPPPMINWLRLASGGSPMKDYAEWREKILMGSFGPRKFVKLLVTTSEVYPPL